MVASVPKMMNVSHKTVSIMPVLLNVHSWIQVHTQMAANAPKILNV